MQNTLHTLAIKHGYKNISDYHNQVFRNYDFNSMRAYGKTENQQLYNKLCESGVIKNPVKIKLKSKGWIH